MTALVPLSTRVSVGNPLGVLSVHLEGGRCKVGCEFCYLGARSEAPAGLDDLGLLAAHVDALDFAELAIAVNQAGETERAAVALLAARARARGRRVTVTTTMPVAAWSRELLDEVDRINLSVDPRKGAVSAPHIEALAARLKERERPLEVVLLATMVTPAFAADLVEHGLLETLVDLPSVDAVALAALKPPPPWCDAPFLLRALGKIAPLLDRALDRRLFLDCWVAARILRLGECPARPDLSPAPGGGLAFRACVYQTSFDFVTRDAAETAAQLSSFVAPTRCPF
jgi:hypothetical protein